mgnify:FL=1
MSTKINVRSPFYLHLVEPSPPLPDYDCNIAQLKGFEVDNQGIITMPLPLVGVIDSITSDDGDFANNKFPSESTDTSRTIKVKLLIPTGYANTGDIFFECPVTATQQGVTSSVVQPTVCSGGPTTSGSISAQSIAVGASSVDIDLAGFFNNETTYAVSNINPVLVTTALSGSVLTLSSNVLAGATTVYAIGRDASYPTTCEATQAISVTITDTPQAFSCTYPSDPALQGGSITQAGVITNPSTIGTITKIMATSGGSAITSVAANTGTAEQNVTLFFNITAPSQYSNGSATVECQATLVQQGTSLPTLTCTLAGLTGQSIARNGSIFTGTALRGTVKTPASSAPFSIVDVDTSRTVNFPVTIPSGYQNAGQDISGGCDVTLIQPATVSVCGTNEFYISIGKSTKKGHCTSTYGAGELITSTSSSINNLLNSQICAAGTPYDGKNLYYGIFTSFNLSAIGTVVGAYNVIKIDNSGIVRDEQIVKCDALGGGVALQV